MMPDKAVRAKTNGLNQCFQIRNINGRKIVKPTESAAQQVEANSSLLKKIPVDSYIDIVMGNPLNYPGSKLGSEDYLPKRSAIWAQAYNNDFKIKPQLHKGCKNCEFRAQNGKQYKSGYHECLNQVTKLSVDEIDKGTVLDIWQY